jgi:nucleoside diphosphate kinase
MSMKSTFIILKPDALKRGLREDILNYFKDRDFQVVRENVVTVDQKRILDHYQEVIERIGSEDFRQAVLREFVDEVVHVQLNLLIYVGIQWLGYGI